ncbi:unnamed protein product, partial [Owenia fusiformis]
FTMHSLGCIDWSVVVLVVYLLSINSIQSSYGLEDGELVIIHNHYMKRDRSSFSENLSAVKHAISKNKKLLKKHDLSNEEIKSSDKAKKKNTKSLKKILKYRGHKKTLAKCVLKFKANIEQYLSQNTLQPKIVIQHFIQLLDQVSYVSTNEFRSAEGENGAMQIVYESLDAVKNKSFLAVVLIKKDKQNAFKTLSKIRKRMAALIDEGSSLMSELETNVIMTLKFK